MLQHVSRSANPAHSFFAILHAAAGRAFLRTSVRDYHSSVVTQDTGVVSRRRGTSDGNVRAAPSYTVVGSSISPQHLPSSPITDVHSDLNSAVHLYQPEGAVFGRTAPQSLSASKDIDFSLRTTQPSLLTSHTVKSRPVTTVDVQNLQSFDMEYLDWGRSPVMPYPDDPPWRDISEALYGLPGSSVGPIDSVWMPHTVLPMATSANVLFQNVLRLMSSESPPTLGELMDYHAQFPSYHSTRSFNTLIALSIRRANFEATLHLLNQMDLQNIPENLETRALRTRYHIRRGHWYLAWQHENATPGSIPLPVWLEFFGTRERERKRTRHRFAVDVEDFADQSHRGEIGISQLSSMANIEEEPCAEESAVEAESHLTRDMARFNILMHNLPLARPSASTPALVRATRSVVSLLLRCRQYDMAETVTMQLFKSLPPSLDISVCFKCLDVIHLHVTTSRKDGIFEFYRIRTLLGRLLRAHPSFRASSRTLFLLLRPLKSIKKCGTVAWHAVQTYQSQWGPKVVDERVCRRVVALALKEGRSDIVEHLLKAQSYAESQQRMWEAMHEVRGGTLTKVPKYPLRLPERRLPLFRRDKTDRRRLRDVVEQYTRERGQARSAG